MLIKYQIVESKDGSSFNKPFTGVDGKKYYGLFPYKIEDDRVFMAALTIDDDNKPVIKKESLEVKVNGD